MLTWLYKLVAQAIMGIHHVLSPLFGVLFALTLCAAYGLFRFAANPLIAAAGVVRANAAARQQGGDEREREERDGAFHRAPEGSCQWSAFERRQRLRRSK